ncbi:MAG: hypothetical protein QXO02_00360 [Thermofilaceae archaeon]
MLELSLDAFLLSQLFNLLLPTLPVGVEELLCTLRFLEGNLLQRNLKPYGISTIGKAEDLDRSRTALSRYIPLGWYHQLKMPPAYSLHFHSSGLSHEALTYTDLFIAVLLRSSERRVHLPPAHGRTETAVADA